MIQSELLLSLILDARPRGRGKAYTELRGLFGGSAQVPDVSFDCADRLPRFDEGERGKDGTLAPDLAVEIRSPDQGLRELRLKLIHSVKHGSKYGWLIDEKRRHLHVFRHGHKSQVLVIGQVLTLEKTSRATNSHSPRQGRSDCRFGKKWEASGGRRHSAACPGIHATLPGHAALGRRPPGCDNLAHLHESIDPALAEIFGWLA